MTSLLQQTIHATPESARPAGRRTLSAINPANGRLLKQIPMATEADVQAARQEAGRLAPIWAAKSVKERIRILRKFQQVIVDQVDDITAVINRDNGKSRQDALIEVMMATDLIQTYLRHAPQWLAEKSVSSGFYLYKQAKVAQRPFGVAAVISPWNYPFVLSIPPIVSALLAGNTVLFKPSEETALVGELIEKLIARVPELSAFVKVLHGDGRIGAALVASKPDVIFLTGSSRTGRLVTQAAAEHLIPVLAELGGKDPMIVLDDADLASAATWGVWGACFNAGQTCMAVERIYVERSVHDQFVNEVIEAASRFSVGFSAETDATFHMGPLTTNRQVEIVKRHLDDAIAKGAVIRTGGDWRGNFLTPTVLTNITDDMLLLQEETFGPIVPIMAVADQEEAIRRANDSIYGLGASVWTQDLARGRAVLERLDAGTLQLNDTLSHFAIPRLPFGGLKQSGTARVHGREDVLQFTQSVSYLTSLPPFSHDMTTVLRQPGHYDLGKAMLQGVAGVTPQQKLQPLGDLLASDGGQVARQAAKGAALGVMAMGAFAGLLRTVSRKK